MSRRAATATGGRGARQRILDSAAELFYREGINATGVERLAAAASVSKRTLYQHFSSKDAVVEEYLRAVGQRVGEVAGDGDLTPRQRLVAVFDAPADPGMPYRGCPFHNAAVECAGASAEVQDIVRNAKRAFADKLTELAEQAGAPDPPLLGDELAVLYEGAAALSTSLDDASPWVHARQAAEALVDSALG